MVELKNKIEVRRAEHHFTERGLRRETRSEEITDEAERREAERIGAPTYVFVRRFWDGDRIIAILYPDNGYIY